jgi:L-seryl-tRNA(Ser) seleniumtransferase
VLLVHDVGSGALLDTAAYGLAHEPTVQESLSAGAAVVAFSGDKLLGGPQAGILAGRREPIERCKRHPLARAVRADKMTLAALQATLGHYLRDEAPRAVPVWRMLATPLDEISARAARWAAALGGEVVAGESTVGGGSLPGATLPTRLVALRAPGGDADALAARLRAGEPPVIARILDDALVLDPRTVSVEEEETLLASCRSALGKA